MTVKTRGWSSWRGFPIWRGHGARSVPAVVIQADPYNATLNHAVVAEVTSNPRWVAHPTCLFIDISTSEGHGTGCTKRCGVLPCIWSRCMRTAWETLLVRSPLP